MVTLDLDKNISFRQTYYSRQPASGDLKKQQGGDTKKMDHLDSQKRKNCAPFICILYMGSGDLGHSNSEYS